MTLSGGAEPEKKAEHGRKHFIEADHTSGHLQTSNSKGFDMNTTTATPEWFIDEDENVWRRFNSSWSLATCHYTFQGSSSTATPPAGLKPLIPANELEKVQKHCKSLGFIQGVKAEATIRLGYPRALHANPFVTEVEE